MVFVVVDELVPEAAVSGNKRLVSKGGTVDCIGEQRWYCGLLV
jgi:hypothetical protein